MLGTWVRPTEEPCKTLKVFFPGQAQELGIYHSAVPPHRRREWSRELLEGKNYHLAPVLVAAGCPVLLLGESKAELDPETLERCMSEVGATQVELMAHSAGYLGLTTLLKRLKGSPLLSKISGIRLLDNFYTPAVLPAVLKATFSESRLRELCSGFYTDHNAQRYQKGFQSLCPSVVRAADHKVPVKDFFR